MQKQRFYLTQSVPVQGCLDLQEAVESTLIELGLAFRDAYNIAGEMVKIAENKCCDLKDLSLEDLQALEPKIDQSVFEVLSLHQSVASRTSYGGTAPEKVSEALTVAKVKYL